jgi:CheY-like chemotaxis protein
MRDVDPSREILVVDDDPLVREVITTVLLSGGYSSDCVKTARDGRDALNQVANHQPSLVLLDVQMPGLDGPGFVQAARAKGCASPVLFVTGQPDPGSIAAACGAEGYIAKPFRPSHLLAAVERFCPIS